MPQFESIAQQVCAQRNYSFQGFAGAGNFKETYHVLLPDNTPTALKVCKPGVSFERNDREIKAMVRCSHANIGRLLSVDKINIMGQDFLIYCEEYLAGGTLTDRIKTHGLLSREAMITFGEALISAIDHIASLDLVHRDIKPDNVMFRLPDSQVPIIVDFGLVRNLADTSLTQTWLPQGPGTPFYASPEQLNNEKNQIDWRSDQFALGVLFSICLFGFHPYGHTGEDPVQTIGMVMSRRGPSQAFSQAISGANLPVIRKMVAPWPVQRYRTSELLINAWKEEGSI